MLPVIVVFAAAAVVTITQRAAAAIRRASRTSILAPAALVAFTAVLALHPVGELLATNRYDNGSPSISGATRSAAHAWIVTNVPPGSRILGEPDTLELHGTHFDVDYRVNTRTQTLADYQRAGYQYFVVNALHSGIYRLGAPHYPREAAFYQDIACHTRLVASFDRAAEQLRDGWPIRIYQLDKAPRRISGYLCTQQVDR
jgi:hypothetical protein